MCVVFLNSTKPTQEVVSLVQTQLNLDFIFILKLSLDSYYSMIVYILHIQTHIIKAAFSL